jgi:hypothetical protein
MKVVRWFAMSTLILSAVCLAGCGEGGTPKEGVSGKPSKEDADVTTNLAKLSSEDRKLAEEQKVCPISGEALGDMGVPIKLTVNDQPVFLCCKGCEKDALGSPDKTLAKVNEFKTKNAPPK